MNETIYDAPQSELYKDSSDQEKPIATTGQRFLNMIIDFFGYIILAFILGIILAITETGEFLENTNDYVFCMILLTLYYVPLELIWGRTLGKWVTKTKVVDEEGNPASFGQIFGRTLVRFVPFEWFSFFGGDGHPRGWHDSWSSTKVISLKKQNDDAR